MNKTKEIINTMTSEMKRFGFKKKGKLFYFEKNGHYALIEFQEGKYSNPTEESFTINLGVFSTYLWNFFSDSLNPFPDSSMAQWRVRIGELLPNKKDHWWKIDDSINLTALTNEIKSILFDLAIPSLNAHFSEEQLIETWLSDDSSGQTEHMKYSYLAVLLKRKKDPRFPVAVNRLKAISKWKTDQAWINNLIAVLDADGDHLP